MAKLKKSDKATIVTVALAGVLGSAGLVDVDPNVLALLPGWALALLAGVAVAVRVGMYLAALRKGSPVEPVQVPESETPTEEVEVEEKP